MTASMAFSRGWGTAVWTLAPRTIVGRGRRLGAHVRSRAGEVREVVRGWELRLFLAGVFVLQVCSQFMPAACRTNSSQPGPSRIPVVHSYHVHVESSAFSQTGG